MPRPPLARLLAALAVALFACPALAAPPADAADKPNVVFIMADDLGWRDTGVYGSDFYETPHIDRLAARGIRFTNAYSASPLCSPTRASVLTGQYPGRIGMTAPHGHVPQVVLQASAGKNGAPQYRSTANVSVSRLKNSYDNYAKDMKAAGYATGFFGKWHLGFEPYIPENQGFDTVVGGGGYPGPRSFFSPYNMPEIPNGPPGEHIDDRMVAEAIAFMDGAIADDKPFLVNYWAWDVHAPFQGKEQLIAKYEAKLAANPGTRQQSPTMGAMVETLDAGVGRLVDALDERGLTDNTLILFFSDNGGNMYNEVEGTTPTNNAPLRNGKGNIYEGGVRVPLVAVWPGHIQPGIVTDALASSIDIYPTLLDLLNLKSPAGGGGQAIDGVSLAPVLLSESGDKSVRDSILIDFPHNVPATGNLASISIREGDWKLIRVYWDADVPDAASPAHRYELYDLATNVGETNNLASSNPDRVREMDGLIAAYLQETGAVQPIPNPSFGKANADAQKDQEQAVGGWTPNQKGTTLEVVDGVLRMTSPGNDPFMSTNDVPDGVTGKIELRIRMKTEAGGGGQVFWASEKSKGFAGARAPEFEPKADGEFHEYAIPLTLNGPLTGLRIDPAREKGTIDFESISVWDADGKQLKEWTF